MLNLIAIGVLLSPKFIGLFLGVYLFLLIGLCGGLESINYFSVVLIVSMVASALIGFKFERITIDICTALCFGLVVALAVDSALNNGLLSIVTAIFHLNNLNSIPIACAKCHVTELTILWIATSVAAFIPLAYQSGLLSTLFATRFAKRYILNSFYHNYNN